MSASMRRKRFMSHALVGLGLALASAASVAEPIPVLSIGDVSISEGNSGITNFVFRVLLDLPASVGGVSFDIVASSGTATAGSDFQAIGLFGQTIAAGASSSDFTVAVFGDTELELTETFFVNITNIVGATASDAQGQGTILTDDRGPRPPGVGVPEPATWSLLGGLGLAWIGGRRRTTRAVSGTA